MRGLFGRSRCVGDRAASVVEYLLLVALVVSTVLGSLMVPASGTDPSSGPTEAVVVSP